MGRNRTLWEKDGKEIPVFAGNTFEEKLSVYDKFEDEEDPFTFKLIQKLLLVCSLFYLGKAETQEDFDILLRVQENQGLINAVDTINKLNQDNSIKTEDKPVETKEEIKV